MGKKSMSKDRGYITASEWAIEGGGYKNKMEGVPFRRLPFNCCAVSFLPFDDPVCTADGTVMDIMHAVPYVQTHGKHPVTGEPNEPIASAILNDIVVAPSSSGPRDVVPESSSSSSSR